ncbi:MAG: hypothetical protein ACREFR_11960 [Limisphaerales bacterium]
MNAKCKTPCFAFSGLKTQKTSIFGTARELAPSAFDEIRLFALATRAWDWRGLSWSKTQYGYED